jgi:hypothetical protein
MDYSPRATRAFADRALAGARSNQIKIAETLSGGRKRAGLYLPAAGRDHVRITIQADYGDEVSINTDVISAEQAAVTLQIKNPIYDSVAEFEEVTLTIDKARELGWALITMADAVEFVSAPVTEVLSALNYPGGHSTN